MLKRVNNRNVAWSIITIAIIVTTHQFVYQDDAFGRRMTFINGDAMFPVDDDNINNNDNRLRYATSSSVNDGVLDTATINDGNEGSFGSLFNDYNMPTMSFKLMGSCVKFMRDIVNYYDDGLQTHPNHILDENEDGDDDSQFVIFCTRFKNAMGGHQVLKLPPRSPSNPYVVWTHHIQLDTCSRDYNSYCEAWSEVFSTRNDILYVGMDSGGDMRLCDDTVRLPGVTLAPSTEMEINPPENEDFLARKYLIFFAGTPHCGWYGSSMVRPWLFRSYEAWKNQTITAIVNDDILITSHMPKEEYTSTLLNSKFALVPHGDGRWNFRLYDVIQAGNIPVFLADGYDPPFHQLINWKSASIALPETAALDFNAFQQSLRSIPPEKVVEMARNVRKINEQCFDTSQKRADCFVKSTSIMIQKQAHTEPPVEFGERLKVPFCPSTIRNDGSGGVMYESLDELKTLN